MHVSSLCNTSAVSATPWPPAVISSSSLVAVSIGGQATRCFRIREMLFRYHFLFSKRIFFPFLVYGAGVRLAKLIVPECPSSLGADVGFEVGLSEETGKMLPMPHRARVTVYGTFL